VYQQTTTNVTGTFTFYSIVRTESGVIGSKEITIEFKYDMALLFEYPFCTPHCLNPSLELFPNKAYQKSNGNCFFTLEQGVSSSLLDSEDITGDLMQMQACSSLCTAGQ
jgi:hypothetical protein